MAAREYIKGLITDELSDYGKGEWLSTVRLVKRQRDGFKGKGEGKGDGKGSDQQMG